MARKKSPARWRTKTTDLHERTINIEKGDETHLTLSLTAGGDVRVTRPFNHESTSLYRSEFRGVVPLDHLEDALEQLATFNEEDHSCPSK